MSNLFPLLELQNDAGENILVTVTQQGWGRGRGRGTGTGDRMLELTQATMKSGPNQFILTWLNNSQNLPS